MGSMMAKAMDESFQKNKSFMMESQVMVMERQLQMQNQMREKMMAMQLSGAREMFNWFASFYGVAFVGCLAGFLKSKNPTAIAPLVPLSFVLGYQYDYTHGTKVMRIREDAEKILKNERDMLSIPLGMPTIAGIDAARQAAKLAEVTSQESK
ncbi:plasminogen receptor (KT)-like [Asterias rubens]|uniref:plasminogen receptor (KT)-like n=1 Tax=Asterias rubens TaxID=7604 RepID=UPI0014551E4A|nr:plasminogen receptor (KT)-like [Asterias rubens]XP_033636496.1 plasminogen receptor (KT)-like [Asterias rubens]XP_033636497.1 plasminogen receptor (KT)-like [Asterias rubens]